jgi:hypothetical protein
MTFHQAGETFRCFGSGCIAARSAPAQTAEPKLFLDVELAVTGWGDRSSACGHRLSKIGRRHSMAINATTEKKKRGSRKRPARQCENPPPHARSVEEQAATAKVVGFPGAFDVTSRSIQQEVWSLLGWES